MERSAAVFWGAGACGCFFAQLSSPADINCSVGFCEPQKRAEARAAFFAFVTRRARVKKNKTGFLAVENIWEEFTDPVRRCCDRVVKVFPCYKLVRK